MEYFFWKLVSKRSVSVGTASGHRGGRRPSGASLLDDAELGSIMGNGLLRVLKGLLREGKAEPSPFMSPRRIPPEVDASKFD